MCATEPNQVASAGPSAHASVLESLRGSLAQLTIRIKRVEAIEHMVDDQLLKVSKVIDRLVRLSSERPALTPFATSVLKDLGLVHAGLVDVVTRTESEAGKLIDLRRRFHLAIAGLERDWLVAPTFSPSVSSSLSLLAEVGLGQSGAGSAASIAGPPTVLPLPGGRCLAVIAGKPVKLARRPAALFQLLILDDHPSEADPAQGARDEIVRWKDQEELRVKLALPPKDKISAHSLEVLVDRLQGHLAQAGLDPRLVQEDQKLGLRFALRSTRKSTKEMDNAM